MKYHLMLKLDIVQLKDNKISEIIIDPSDIKYQCR